MKLLQHYAMINCNSNTYFGSLTRISDLKNTPFQIKKAPRKIWATGDYIVGRYVGTTEDEEDDLELSNGKSHVLKLNDLFVGALGDRQATQEVVGTWKLIDEASNPVRMDMICGSGIFGIETSRCSRYPPSPKFVYEGHCCRQGEKVFMKDFRPREKTNLKPHCKMILLVGSSMSCGKTFTASSIVSIIKHDLGFKNVAAIKFTGAGYNHDIEQFAAAGADFVCDFVDVGYPSTVVPADEYRKLVLPSLLQLLAEQNPECIVGEVGASPLEDYNGMEVLKELLSDTYSSQHVSIVFCSTDAYGILGLRQVLETEGLNSEILGVSGMAACNTAASALVQRVSRLQAFNLQESASVDDLRKILKKYLLDGSCHPSHKEVD